MTKYTFEFKLKIVKEYLDKRTGYHSLSKKYGFKDTQQIRRWIFAYEIAGEEGLKTGKNRAYSTEVKLNAVNLYLTSNWSARDIAKDLGIIDYSRILDWVRRYRSDNFEAFKQSRGRPKTGQEIINKKTELSLDEKDFRIRELERELENTKIELKYFKRIEEAENGTTSEGKARLVQTLHREFKFPIKQLLIISGLPKATYYYWVNCFGRPNKDEEIEKVLIKLRKLHPNAGYRPMVELLKREGYIVNHKKVQRLMRKLGLCITSFWRKTRKYSSYRGKVGKVAKNLLNRRFNSKVVHQKLVTDTTEFKYYDNGQVKKAYLNPYMDLFNREIVSFEISKQPNFIAISNALSKAIEITSDCPYRRTFHSDQGWAYQTPYYRQKLQEHNIYQSMSRKGNCHDNSVVENFFGILKQEVYYGKRFDSFESLEITISNYIHYYNNLRIKKNLSWLSPIEYRKSFKNK
ncbi:MULTISPECIES: IS3 family transposase [Lactococcus]|uniref:IS3 family transposase n=1 Tax=Lactococcus TaxID=1357 RepID=UPI0019667995|nr:IS3 family transposase [Lactococcus cremoris]WKD56485.1 IS3 family transposase [Lactococcus cremoris]WKD56489.1 IS3 family transposase [Lactococcus cremoris]